MRSFRVLGPIEARAGDRPVALGGGRQLKLFAFLLLHANAAISSDTLIDAVWGPERDGAVKRLHMAIARLRKALEPLDIGGNLLRTVSGGYLLSIASGELDADVFAERVRDGRSALAEGDPARAREQLGQALKLWHGAPLAEVAFEDFAQGEIRRLEELRLSALESRIDADLQLGRHAELVGELEALLDEQPTRERFAGQLMVALYRSGRQVDALEVYQRTRKRLVEELGLEPGPGLQTLHTQILDHASHLDSGRSGHQPHAGPASLTAAAKHRETVSWALRSPIQPPFAPTPTIGRRREIEELTKLLTEPGVRLITLTGPGGVGKTRLALELAHVARSSFDDGVCWVELAGLSNASEVEPTIVRALAATPIEQETITDALQRYVARRQLLLILDNFEHVIDAAETVAGLLAACDSLRILATSREALNVRSEHVRRVRPLAVPRAPAAATAEDVNASDAMALFVQAARRHDSNFATSSANAAVIAGLCARLDGLPLALELAAAHASLFSVEELSVRLDDVMAGSGKAPRDSPVRQRSLRSTIEWSYDLLDHETRIVFAHLAVFPGGAALASAQAVTGATVGMLEALIGKSLLECYEAYGVRRVRMLEQIREFALRRLTEDPEEHRVRQRHCEHYLALVERTVGPFWVADEADSLAAIDAEASNLNAALGWSLSTAPDAALRLAGRLGEYWYIRHTPVEGLRWLNATLRAAGESAPLPHRALAHLHRAHLLALTNQTNEPARAARTALALYRLADDELGVSESLCSLAGAALRKDDMPRLRTLAEAACRHARAADDAHALGKALALLVPTLPPAERAPSLEQAADLLATTGDHRALAWAYHTAAHTRLIEGRIDEATALLDLALPVAEKVNSPDPKAYIVGTLGMARLLAHDHHEARTAFEAQLHLCLEHRCRAAEDGLAGLAALAAHDEQLERAAHLLGAALSVGFSFEAEGLVGQRLERDYFDPARAGCAETTWAQAEESGAAMSYENAVAFALAQSRPIARPATQMAEESVSQAKPASATVVRLQPSGAQNRQSQWRSRS